MALVKFIWEYIGEYLTHWTISTQHIIAIIMILEARAAEAN